jgi:hypothetical protein
MGRNESPGTKESAKSRMTSFIPIIHVVDDDESFRVAFARLLQAALYEVQHVFVSE